MSATAVRSATDRGSDPSAITGRRWTPGDDVRGGIAMYLAMVYIAFVNPAILSAAGLPFEAVAVMTLLVASFFTLLMGVVTKLPLVMAPGMGLNAIVAFDIILGHHVKPDVGMACIFLEGLLALALVMLGFREAIANAVPETMKLAIGVGIGLFIALIGLQYSGIVVNDPATGIGAGDLTTGPALVSLAGILVAFCAYTRNARGAVLLGVITSTVLGLVFGVLDGPDKILQWPNSGDFSTFGLGVSSDGLSGALTWTFVPVIFALFMSDFFDTIGTVEAVANAGDLKKQGKIRRYFAVLFVDSAAAAGGGGAGVSSVTTYAESGAGSAEGAKTGLASGVTAVLLLLTIPLIPLIKVVGQGVPMGKATVYPAIAPALVMVGLLMVRLVKRIDWDDQVDAATAFVTILAIPATFSIATGIGLGVFTYIATSVAKGRITKIHPLMWAVLLMFMAFFASGWLETNVF